MRVLIAEDDKVTRLVLRRILEGMGGVEVLEAEDGQKAWELMEVGPMPDLCFLDINMPRMNGLDLLKKVRNDKKLSRLKVCFSSAVRDRQTIVQAAALQPDHYILKPFSVAAIRDQVQKVRAALDPEANLDPSEEVCGRLGIDQETYLAMLDLLEQQVKELTASIPNLLMQLDISGALAALDQTRTSAQNLGARRLLDLADNLTRCFRGNQSSVVSKPGAKEALTEDLRDWIVRSSDQLFQTMQQMRVEVQQIAVVREEVVRNRDKTRETSQNAQSKRQREVDNAARCVSAALQHGKLVAANRATRSRSLTLPISASILGEAAQETRGALTRKVSFKLKILDDETAAGIENSRKNSDLIKLLSFPLDAGRRWMPEEAIRLLELEVVVRNKQAMILLHQAVGSDFEDFLRKQEGIIRDNLEQLCREIDPNAHAPEERVQSILEELRERFKPAFAGLITTAPVFTTFELGNLADENEDSRWEAAYGALYHSALLFRNSVVDRSFDRVFKFATFDRETFLQAMNIFSDAILGDLGAQRAPRELQEIEAIAASPADFREKSRLLFALIKNQPSTGLGNNATPPALTILTKEIAA